MNLLNQALNVRTALEKALVLNDQDTLNEVMMDAYDLGFEYCLEGRPLDVVPALLASTDDLAAGWRAGWKAADTERMMIEVISDFPEYQSKTIALDKP